MIRVVKLLKRSFIFVHRWLGVALSAIFMLWFLSGIVMMCRSFPSVTARDRIEHLPVLDPADVKLSAEQAFAVAGSENQPLDVLLTSFDGRPVYLGSGTMIYADDGSEHRDVNDAMIDRAAVVWVGRPLNEATKTAVEEADQWTLSSELRALRPMYKYSWRDGQEVYIDGRTADVVQYTTRASRIWAYLGAIPHWLYFRPLRMRQGSWFSLVVWSSLVGTVAAVMGVAIAVWMYSPRRRYRHEGVPTGIPYRGWKRWHAIVGLLFGVITTTWTFSGLLTMGLVGSYSAHQWVERWLSRGLHSLDFPWLYNNRPLWDVVVITLMLGGTALCTTSLVLTWRVVARTAARVLRARIGVPNEDLSPQPFDTLRADDELSPS